MHTSLYIIYVYSQKICICMYCFPARTSGSYICSYCIICKAPLFSDWKTWLVPPPFIVMAPRVRMDARCIHALSHLGCYYSTSQNRKLLSYTTILNLSMTQNLPSCSLNNRATTFLTCFGASARIIFSVSKTPSFLPIQVLYNCMFTWALLYVYPEWFGRFACMHAHAATV